MTTNRKRYVKKEIGTVSNFIDHIKFHLICGIVGKIWVVESERANRCLEKGKGNFCVTYSINGCVKLGILQRRRRKYKKA